MISDEYFYNLSQPLLDRTEQLTLSILEELRAIAITISNDGIINLDEEQQRLLRMWADWDEDAEDWVDENLPEAYKKGLSEADKIGGTLTAGSFASTPLFGASFGGSISDKAMKAFEDIPNHLTMYGVFQEQAYEGLKKTRVPVVRSSMDVVRDLSVLASDETYRTANTLTRRELSQEIMRPFADRGITGIIYRDGRRVNLDSYAEMVARTQTGNAARQANFNRLQEYGIDLVLISQHYPTSDLCAPYQGRVFSISGSSDQYPSLQSAISGGLYHPNCKHSQSGYKRGQNIPEAREKVDSAKNKKRYEASQVQRYNERQIKSWKRREASAVTSDAQQKAKQKVREWQKRQRQHLDSNEYLRRRYSREKI
jgi:hypothetical protein